jgi:hypothetical protein
LVCVTGCPFPPNPLLTWLRSAPWIWKHGSDSSHLGPGGPRVLRVGQDPVDFTLLPVVTSDSIWSQLRLQSNRIRQILWGRKWACK